MGEAGTNVLDSIVAGVREDLVRREQLTSMDALKERASKVAYWHQWPDEYDRLVQKWDEFLSA